jgi:hypothetical protein
VDSRRPGAAGAGLGVGPSMAFMRLPRTETKGRLQGVARVTGGPEPLLRQAHIVLLVMRTSLDAVVSARARAGWLRELLADSTGGPEGLGLLAGRRGATVPGRGGGQGGRTPGGRNRQP